MGGPNISTNLPGKEAFLAQNQDVDILVEGDGEIVALEILKTFYASNKSILPTKHSNIMNCFAYDNQAKQHLLTLHLIWVNGGQNFQMQQRR